MVSYSYEKLDSSILSTKELISRAIPLTMYEVLIQKFEAVEAGRYLQFTECNNK